MSQWGLHSRKHIRNQKNARILVVVNSLRTTYVYSGGNPFSIELNCFEMFSFSEGVKAVDCQSKQKDSVLDVSIKQELISTLTSKFESLTRQR